MQKRDSLEPKLNWSPHSRQITDRSTDARLTANKHTHARTHASGVDESQGPVTPTNFNERLRLDETRRAGE